jgi:hypothetical protein
MDLFGIKKRKKIKEEKRAQEEYKLKRIKYEYKILKGRAKELSDAHNNDSREWAKKFNGKCPKCSSTKVNDRIKRIEGEFSGEGKGSVSGFGILGTGIMHGSYRSESSGKIDTNEVNKCGECGHEWKKREADWIYDEKLLKKGFKDLSWKMERYKKATEAEIDPKDLDEEYESNEAKRAALVKDATSEYIEKSVRGLFQNVSIESILAIAELEIWKSSWDTSDIESFKESFNVEFLEKMGLKHMELNV